MAPFKRRDVAFDRRITYTTSMAIWPRPATTKLRQLTPSLEGHHSRAASGCGGVDVTATEPVELFGSGVIPTVSAAGGVAASKAFDDRGRMRGVEGCGMPSRRMPATSAGRSRASANAVPICVYAGARARLGLRGAPLEDFRHVDLLLDSLSSVRRKNEA